MKASAAIVILAGILAPLSGCSAPSSEGLDQQFARILSELVENNKSVRNCVMSVAKGNGSIRWSGAAGIARQNDRVPMTKDTPIYVASVTKLYTAAAIMRLCEEGALSLNDPMSRYLPEGLIRGIHVYEGKDYSRDITIGQLLSHTSGIADYYDEKPKGGKSLFELFLEDPDRPWTVDETIDRARNDLRPNFPPGSRASYSDTNFQLLGKVIEAVSGRQLQVVFDDFFFRPLGLTHTWLIGLSRPRLPSLPAPAEVFYKDINITKARSNGAYWADGGIVSTADEMIIFLKALKEGRIIRRDTLESMHHWRKWHFPLQYGYGTMYFKLPSIASRVTRMAPLWGHSGSTGSFLYYSEELDLYMAGSVDQVDSKILPFKLMQRTMRAVQRLPKG